ncbi:cell division protein SepF [Solibacillus sp. MA9]|uniref:Cell division protein SepF n=1 Tax=Solibacillus palustris TaxID=2908203 RepID=A0ABS9U9N1_9BACL|nr:cell division protein SepF [Solibacillus sp. MA9]MCH7320850.1 cell division protein SepF [Solibacillus sp. MA9]
MSIKNIFDKFFYLEDIEEDQAPDQAQATPSKQVPKATPQDAYYQEAVQKQQTQVIQNRMKKERKVTQQRNEVIMQPNIQNSNNVVSLQAAASSKNSKLVLIEPRVYAEAQDIAEHLKQRRATVVNLQRIDRDQGKRIIDFLSGTVYALGGDIQRIGNDIFLCTPENVEVSGEISNLTFE